jgi:diguanylate cyclase (GGDEF)-like protein
MDSEDLGVEAMRCGAQDFLVKGNYDNSLIVRSIRHSIERHRLLQKLKRLAVLDELTGLYNRRGFKSLATEDLEKAIENKHTVFIIYFDIDDFKTINDTYGHDKGDDALRWVSNKLISTFRQNDILARFGGDEFVALGTIRNSDEIETIETRLKKTLETQNHNFPFPM